jgi:hypothetical protein
MPNPPQPASRSNNGRSFVVFGVLGLIGAGILFYLVLMLPWWLAAKDEEEWDRECCQPTPSTGPPLAPGAVSPQTHPTGPLQS